MGMTLDEAIEYEEELAIFSSGICKDIERKREYLQLVEWLKDYKRLKEQEPCGDTISRQAVLDKAFEIKTGKYTSAMVVYAHDIRTLPPVILQPKIGHWIDDKCSVCGKGTEDLISSREWYRNEEPNFCPFCGLKLVKPQESEE